VRVAVLEVPPPGEGFVTFIQWFPEVVSELDSVSTRRVGSTYLGVFCFPSKFTIDPDTNELPIIWMSTESFKRATLGEMEILPGVGLSVDNTVITTASEVLPVTVTVNGPVTADNGTLARIEVAVADKTSARTVVFAGPENVTKS